METLDGSKVFLEKDSWILFRQSGTEPLLRVYCEAPSAAGVQEILSAGLKFVEQTQRAGVVGLCVSLYNQATLSGESWLLCAER